MCRHSKNLAIRLNRRLAHHRRCFRRHPTQYSAGHRSDLHLHRRCSAKANQPRANQRPAAKYRQSRSDQKNRRRFGHRSSRRSRPRHHRTGHQRRRRIRLASHRLDCRRPVSHRPDCRRLVIHPSCRLRNRRRYWIRSVRPTDRPGCPGKKQRRPTSRRRSHRPVKAFRRWNDYRRRSTRHWACCWMTRLTSRRHWSRMNPRIRRSRRSACCSKTTRRKTAVEGNRP
jgi:hypothetical protein